MGSYILYDSILIQVSAKQQKASARNARLNHLVDSGFSAEFIKAELKSLNLQFIRRIIYKRNL